MTTNMAGKIETTAIASGGILSRERIVAKAGFNRWLAPPHRTRHSFVHRHGLWI